MAKPTKMTKAMGIDVSLSLSPKAEELLVGIDAQLGRLADAFDILVAPLKEEPPVVVEYTSMVFGPDDPIDEEDNYPQCPNCGGDSRRAATDGWFVCEECNHGWKVEPPHDPDYKPTGPPEHVEVP